MATAEEHPLKKRKLHEPYPEIPEPPPQPPPTPPPPPPPPPQALPQSFVAPLTQEEILRKRRNREEIRSLYECYKRIRVCVSQKDARLMPELEQSYLSLITASRGCTSVQRILADLIPRYASYCPTALEAAVKVVVNMYNWSSALMARGEDADNVAFQTAKACILGLADICYTASVEAPTSSVIRGITTAVFLNVLTFFASSCDDQIIFQIVNIATLETHYSTELFSQLKQKFSDEDEPVVVKLSKFRALSLLRIFCSCSKNALAACFELFGTPSNKGIGREGHWLLRLLTTTFEASDVSHPSHKKSDGSESCPGSTGLGFNGTDNLTSKCNPISIEASPFLKNCLLKLVLEKDSSLKSWMFSKIKNLFKSVAPEIVSEISSVLEGVFESFKELVNSEGSEYNTDEECGTRKLASQQYLLSKVSSQHENFYDISQKSVSNSRVHSGCFDGTSTDPISGQHLNTQGSGSDHDSGGSRSMGFGEQRDPSWGWQLVDKDFPGNQIPSPMSGKPSAFRCNSFKSSSTSSIYAEDNHQVSSKALTSPRNHPPVPPTTSQSVWHFDGDPAAMDIFSASKQLWVGSLGPDASEVQVRLQFERFGPVDRFVFYLFKGFALVDYRNIMDAVRARKHMRGQSPWGACLQIKFMDVGLGTRGSINGAAVGSSCHVYIGNIHGPVARDEVMHETRKVIHKVPQMVTDLSSEGALLINFKTPEEANAVMTHLRRHRWETTNRQYPSNVGFGDDARGSYVGPANPVSSAMYTDHRNSNSGNMLTGVVGSPLVHRGQGVPAESIKARQMSHLSSLLSSLGAKYNICQTYSHFDSHLSANHHGMPTHTLQIILPNVSSSVLTDDELMSICNLAIGNVGSVIRLTRLNSLGCHCLVECSSADAASTALKNLRGCPGIFFQVDFSSDSSRFGAPYTGKPEKSLLGLPSPRMMMENNGATVGVRKLENYDHKVVVNPSQGGGHVVSGATDQMWMYQRPDVGNHHAPGSILGVPPVIKGTSIAPPQQVITTSFVQPCFPPPSNSWDARGLNHHFPLNPNIPGFRGDAVAAPFLSASVTPLAQMHGTSSQHSEQMYSMPFVPPLSCPPPPQPEMPPPILPSPPPLPQSQPPAVPPPPKSPPRPPVLVESSNPESSGQHLQYQWLGTLCKSGVHYCTIYAHRALSDACKYLNAVSEPTEWPAKLDMTKRTDFRHVKSSFTSTPPHKREVCWLRPSSAGDHKGFQNFITYLKQRECAGVIKIPAATSMWARLLFILPHTPDVCSMLSISPNPSDCLIALIVPKEVNE